MTSTALNTRSSAQAVPLVAVMVISDLEYGGAQRQVVELANRLEAENITVYVCSLSSYVPLSTFLTARNRLRLVLRRTRFDFTVVFRLAWFLWKINADVVHAFLFDAEIAARLAGRLVGRPVVIGSERNANYSLKRTDRFALRVTRWCQHRVIANSRSGADFNSTLIGYPRAAYRVVRNGVDVQRFRPRPSRAVRENLGIPHDAFVIGMFASFKPQKNHGMLLAVARDIIEKVDRVRFLFVGDALHKGMSDSDTYKAELSQRVTVLGLGDRCIFAGNRSNVESIYPACDVTVLPSLFEGTPNVLLESMACGVPVIATDVSDNREIVPHGIVGFIVPSGDEGQLRDRILELQTDEDLRHRMSRSARDWATEHLSSERLAERTASVYREAVMAKSERRGPRGD